MPVHLLPYLVSSGSSISLIHPNAVLLVFLLLSLLVLRRWTNGVDLLARLEIRQQAIDERLRQEAKIKGKGAPPELAKQTGAERDLHGTTWLVVASLVGGDASPASLLVLAGLASRGAQLVVLLPSTHFHDVVDDEDEGDSGGSKTSRVVLPSALQLLQLLRDGANNELIFAEECDLRDVGSVDHFVAKWAQGEGGSSDVGGLGAGPAAGGAASGLLNPGSGGHSGAGADEGPGRSARRCDGVLLLPYSLQGEHRASYESLKREHLGRFHLINSLLPSLLMLPPQRDIRVVQWVSPWYAAGVVRFEAEQREMGKQDGVKEGEGKTTATADGAVNGSGAKKRKGKGATAAKSTPASATSSFSSSSFSRQPLSVATYGALTLDSLLVTLESQRRLVLLAEADPRPRNPLPGIMDEAQHQQQGQSQKSSRSHAPNISYIPICPGFERVTEVWSWAWLGAPNSSTTNGITRLASFIRRLAVLACWPLALILAKSPKAAADELLWGCVAPVDAEGGVKSLMAMSAANPGQRESVGGAMGKLPEEGDAEGRWRGILPGRLYRQGKVVRLPVREEEELLLGGERAERRWGRWEREVREGVGR